MQISGESFPGEGIARSRALRFTHACLCGQYAARRVVWLGQVSEERRAESEVRQVAVTEPGNGGEICKSRETLKATVTPALPFLQHDRKSSGCF